MILGLNLLLVEKRLLNVRRNCENSVKMKVQLLAAEDVGGQDVCEKQDATDGYHDACNDAYQHKNNWPPKHPYVEIIPCCHDWQMLFQEDAVAGMNAHLANL